MRMRGLKFGSRIEVGSVLIPLLLFHQRGSSWALRVLWQEEERFLTDSLLSAYRFRNVSIINWLRLRYDAAAWRWQSFIVGFDSGEQINLLKLWFGEIKVGWFVAALLGSWIAILGSVDLVDDSEPAQ